jgi:GNAT superfamily N-acetyltransferase
VMHEAFVEYESAYTPEAFAATTPTSQQVQHRMSEGPVWVALQDDVIVGTISLLSKREGVYLRGIAILPCARGQRIGTFLLEQAEPFLSTIRVPEFKNGCQTRHSVSSKREANENVSFALIAGAGTHVVLRVLQSYEEVSGNHCWSG